MSQRNQFVIAARGEIGTIEGPKENETKYGKFSGAQYLPWCGSFVMWCANQVGLKIPNCVSTLAGAKAFEKQGRFQKAEVSVPEVGDLAFFDFPADNLDRISHIGIVARVDIEKGLVWTIEGNTSPDVKGDQRNGGQVCQKKRAFKVKNGGKLKKSIPVFIVGFGKPKFKD
jgi:hypothetical protein